MHTVQTTHIRQMLSEAMDLATDAHGIETGAAVKTDHSEHPTVPIEHVLGRLANLAQHIAAEAEDERMRVLGWK